MADAGKGKSVAYWVFAAAVLALLIMGTPDFDARPPAPAPVETLLPSDNPPDTGDPAPAPSEVRPATPEEWNEQVETPDWDGPSLTVKARFRVRPAGADAEGDFTTGQPVGLWADGKLVADTRQEHGLRMPVASRTVLFKVMGYRSVTRDVPAAVGGAVDFGNVVFEPDAAVRVCLTGAPVDGGEVRLVVGKMTTAPYAVSVSYVAGGKAEAVLPAPSGENLQVTAYTQSTANQNTWFASQAMPVRLRPGETGNVEVKPLPGVRIALQVQGPSPSLLPYLTVMLRTSPPTSFVNADRDAPRTRLDPQGRATFLVRPFRFEVGIPIDSKTVTLTASDGSGPQQSPADDVELKVQPTEALVGVVVRQGGTVVPSRLSLQAPVSATTPQRLCHLMTAAELRAATELGFSTGTTTARTCTQADLQFDGDLVHIDVERCVPHSRLTVRVEIPAAYLTLFELIAVPEAGGSPIPVTGIRSPFQATVPAGAWRLQWKCSGGPGPTIEQLVLAPGEHREVKASVPSVQKWQAFIVDPSTGRGELGLLTGNVNLRVGDHRSLPGTTTGGRLTVYLPAGVAPTGPAQLHMHELQMNVPVQIQALDQTRSTFAVVHGLTKADCVNFQSRGLGKGKRQIALSNAATPDVKQPVVLGAQTLLPMVPGSEREGCLLEQVDGEKQVTCWFTARHGQRELLLEPRGHWTTVRIEKNGGVVQVEGPASMAPFKVAQLREAGECRIYVADGTRAVHVLTGSTRETFAPEKTEIVVR